MLEKVSVSYSVTVTLSNWQILDIDDRFEILMNYFYIETVTKLIIQLTKF